MSHQIIKSDDFIFDESFSSAVATTWQQQKDSLALQPIYSHIPDITTTMEQTRTIEDLHSAPAEEDDTPSLCDFMNTMMRIFPLPPAEDDETPMAVDSCTTLRHSTRPHRPNLQYANLATAVEWANIYSDFELLEACVEEAHQHFMPSSEDTHSWEPPSCSIRDILNMPDRMVRRSCLAVVKKELKTLFGTGTFVFDTLLDREISVPMMEIFKVKINSDGSLDKVKNCLVVRGDLLIKHITEDKWSPIASFLALKMLLAYAAKLWVHV